jgi:hypothetical protein
MEPGSIFIEKAEKYQKLVHLFLTKKDLKPLQTK